ncbi:MAG TPA: PHB depolymerase family esterase [Pirellulales bacterium]
MLEAHDFEIPQVNAEPGRLPYRLFVPADQMQARPLVVWLHGLGESGHDNVHQLRWTDTLVFQPPHECARYPFFFLVPQCPRQDESWHQVLGIKADGEPGEVLDFVAALIRRTIDDYPIDPDHVTLAGLSSGGTACWELAARNPGLFAAIAPLASSGSPVEGIEQHIDIPVWAFHSIHDTNLEARIKETVNRLQKAEKLVHLSTVDGDGHNCWSMAFEEYHLLDWLLAARRGHSSPLPGSISLKNRSRNLLKSWEPWQLVLTVFVPLMMAIATWSALRSRTRMAVASSTAAPED